MTENVILQDYDLETSSSSVKVNNFLLALRHIPLSTMKIY